MKVVINKCFGGFSLSPEAVLKLYEAGEPGIATPVDEYYAHERDEESILGRKRALREWREYLAGVDKGRGMFLTVFSPDEKFVLSSRPDDRASPRLVSIVEELGEKADGACAELAVIEIPDGAEYEIQEYDGNEHIAEKHRTWG